MPTFNHRSPVPARRANPPPEPYARAQAAYSRSSTACETGTPMASSDDRIVSGIGASQAARSGRSYVCSTPGTTFPI